MAANTNREENQPVTRAEMNTVQHSIEDLRVMM